MKRISKLNILVVTVTAILLITIFFALMNQIGLNTESQFRPLDTPIQLPLPTLIKERTASEAAFEYVRDFLPDKSSNTEVLLIKPISFADYESLGLGKFNPANQANPRLELVLLKGQFDTSNYGIGQKVSFKEAAYVVVVYDLDAKAITNVTVSVNGDELKPILNLISLATSTPQT